jgi:hypothetical protein
MRPNTTATTTKVWDGFIRLFHWSLVASFAALYITSHMGMQNAHMLLGYCLILLLAARIVWGFVGSQHARFRDFSYSPATSDVGLEDPAFVARASLDEVKTMLPWCIRGGRFCSGHWGHVIESGKVRLLLKRLAVIRQELGQSRSTE